MVRAMALHAFAEGETARDTWLVGDCMAFGQHPRDDNIMQRAGEARLRRAPRRAALAQDVGEHLQRAVDERVREHVPSPHIAAMAVMHPVGGEVAGD